MAEDFRDLFFAAKGAAAVEIGKGEDGDGVAIEARDDHVPDERRAMRDDLGAQRSDADPCAGR